MLQHSEPDDYVIGTGESHTVREFVEAAFKHAGINNWQDYIEVDPRYLRPAEIEHLVADYSKAKRVLGWEPKIKFKELVGIMVDADLARHGLKNKNTHQGDSRETSPHPDRFR